MAENLEKLLTDLYYEIPSLDYVEKITKELKESNLCFKYSIDEIFDKCCDIHKYKLSSLQSYTEDTIDLKQKHGYNTKNALLSYIVLKVIVDFCINGFKDIKSCLKFNGEDLDFLMAIKNGEFSERTFINFINHYVSANLIHCKNMIAELTIKQ